LFFNTDKVLSTTLFEQRVFCLKSEKTPWTTGPRRASEDDHLAWYKPRSYQTQHIACLTAATSS